MEAEKKSIENTQFDHEISHSDQIGSLIPFINIYIEPERKTINFLAIHNFDWMGAFNVDENLIDLYVTRYNKETNRNEYVLFDIMVVDRVKFNEIKKELGVYTFTDQIEYEKDGIGYNRLIVECEYSRDYSDFTTDGILMGHINRGSLFITKVLENSVLSSHLKEDYQLRQNLSFIYRKKVMNELKGNWVILRSWKSQNQPDDFFTAQTIFKSVTKGMKI